MITTEQITEQIAANDERSKPTIRAPKPYARPLAEITADLSKPIAPEHLQTKVLKGQTITFIPRARPLPLQPRQQGEEAMTTTTIAKTRAGQPAPVLLTVQEAADLLRVTTRTLYQMVAEARIPYRRVGKALRFDRAEILEWTKTNTREE